MGALDDLRRRQREVATTYTEVFVDEILGESQRVVPLAEGTLGASASRRTEQTADGVDVIAYYSQVYARRQHEELHWRHRPGRQAKYLEAPFKAAVNRYPAGLARALATTVR